MVAVLGAALVLIAGAIVFVVLRPEKPAVAAAPVTPSSQESSTSAEPTMSSSPETTESTETPTSTVPTEPADVVQAFYDAINAHDYATAWQLGGKNLGRSFDQFSAGFANTVRDDMTITSVDGDVVDIQLSALESDGAQHPYVGSYTVQDGEIVHGTLRAGSG